MFNVINLHFWPYICILITKNYQQRTSKFKFKRYQKKTINACDHRLLIEYMNRSCVYSAKNSKKIIEFLQSEQVSVRATNVLKLHSNNKIQNLLPIFNTFLWRFSGSCIFFARKSIPCTETGVHHHKTKKDWTIAKMWTVTLRVLWQQGLALFLTGKIRKAPPPSHPASWPSNKI